MKTIMGLGVVVLGVLGATGCGSSDSSIGSGDAPGGGMGGGAQPTTFPAALDTYAWPDPAAAGDVKSNPKPVDLAAKETDQNESVFQCTAYDHDTTAVYDKIAWLEEESGPVKPGLVLQGRAFKQGQLLPVPVKRAPIKVSINLAIPDASRTIDAPDSASIQDAISKFQAEADALADTPGNIEHSIEEVTTKEQIALSLGVHASYSGVLASAHLDTNITHESGLTQHTVVAKLVQPVYTISFADEALPTAASFFDPSLTDADWQAQLSAGTISADNPPVFVSSVTYGRLVMVSLSSTQGESVDTLKTLIEGSTTAFSASASIDASQQKEWSTLKHQEYQRGGSANGAAEALQTGDFSKFFGKAPPSTMVPISFTVKTLSGNRKVALIGDLTKYNAPDCETKGSWTPQTTLAEGAFDSIGVGNSDDVWAKSPAQPRKLFHFDPTATTGPKFTPVDVTFDPAHVSDIKQVSVGRDGTVGMLLADHSALIYSPTAKTFKPLDQGQFNFDAGDGNRQSYYLDVFDANKMTSSNTEDITWTTDGYTNKNFVNTSSSGIVGIDQFNKIWHAPLSGGVIYIDTAQGSQVNVGSLPKKVDALAVGAPNDVWITYDGGIFHFDKASQTDSNVPAWQPKNMGVFTPIMDVGVDGHLWGITADGRIHRWLGLRP